MSSCVASGREDLLYELVSELQLEIDSLKHNTHADRKELQAIRQQVSHGLNLSFPNPELEEKRQRRRKK